MSASIVSTPDFGEKRVRNYAAKFFDADPELVVLEALTPDASTRKYYRIRRSDNRSKPFVLSLYATPFNPHSSSFLDVTRLFQSAGLPVPAVIDVAGTEGIILQEDLGDMCLSAWMKEASPRAGAEKLEEAIQLIVRIQAATALAYETGSVAASLAFDADKLGWELNYFYDHFFGSYRHEKMSEDEAGAIRSDLEDIAAELAERPRVLTHRDYHAMNLMVDANGNLRIIDHQDARMGPATYDLVPILVERRLHPADPDWVESYLEIFTRLHDRAVLDPIDPAELRYEFQLMTIQRQLKAIGTFSYQSGVVGRGEVYERYITPAIQTVLRAMEWPGIKAYDALRRKLASIVRD